jgi:hypothetical protein
MRERLGNSCRTNGITVLGANIVAEKGTRSALCCDIVIHSNTKDARIHAPRAECKTLYTREGSEMQSRPVSCRVELFKKFRACMSDSI